MKTDEWPSRKTRLIMNALSHVAHNPKELWRLKDDVAEFGYQYARMRIRSWGEGMPPMGASDYRDWYQRYEAADVNSESRRTERLAALSDKPKFSILLPAYNPPVQYLREAIDSVTEQSYPNWELLIVDDASTDPHLRPLIEEAAARDSRIQVFIHEVNANLCAGRNTGMAAATGDFMTLIDADDLFAKDALLEIAETINKNPQAALIYSDEDRIDQNGRRYAPIFKPDWNHELLLGQNFVHHLVVFKSELLRSIGGYRVGYEGAEDYDCIFRASEATDPSRIFHVPKVLYHWRRFTNSGSILDIKIDLVESMAQRVVQEHLDRIDCRAVVTKSPVPGFREVHPTVLEPLPSVTVFCVGGKDTPCRAEELQRFEDSTKYEKMNTISLGEFEISYLDSLNKAALSSQSDILVFMSGIFSPSSYDWLQQLVTHLMTGNTGVVGPKLITKDNRIWMSNCVLDPDHLGYPSHRGQPADSFGYDGRLKLMQRCSAVSLSGLVTRRRDFERLEGFDVNVLSGSLAAIDYCLRMSRDGHPAVWVPYVECRLGIDFKTAMGLEQKERLHNEAGVKYFRDLWGEKIQNDPHFSPNLSLGDGHCGFAMPPRSNSAPRLSP